MDIKQRLLELPDQIAELEQAVFKKQTMLEEILQQERIWESGKMDEICNAVDEATGKPKFSNDAKRQAELLRLKSTDQQYLALEAERKAFFQEIRMTEIDIRRLSNLQSNLRSICRLESESA